MARIIDAGGVIVIGGGIVGAAIAWRLAQAGSTVTLMDMGVLGRESSWAGAGMLAPGGEISTRSGWAEAALESLKVYPDFVAELKSESGGEIDYRQSGGIEIARTEEEWKNLQARRGAQCQLGIRSEITADGIFYPDDAMVDPRETMLALRRALELRGVRILEHTAAKAVRVGASHAEIETADDRLDGSAAVLAAGAWSGAIPVSHSSGEPIPIPVSFPVRGHLLGYQMEPGSLGPILRHGHTYVMQRSSGFTIAGTSSEEVGFDRTIDPQILAEIHARAMELAPALGAAAEPTAWLGFRPATEGFEPVIGRVEDTCLWTAYGHYRNGILLAPVTAARIAGEIRSR